MENPLSPETRNCETSDTGAETAPGEPGTVVSSSDGDGTSKEWDGKTRGGSERGGVIDDVSGGDIVAVPSTTSDTYPESTSLAGAGEGAGTSSGGVTPEGVQVRCDSASHRSRTL